MYLYKLIHPDWEEDWWITYLESDPDRYFEIEDKYIYALTTIIKSCGYETLNVRYLINHDTMEYILDSGIYYPIDSEFKEWDIQYYEDCTSRFPDKYPESMRQLYRNLIDGLSLDINQIEDAYRLKLRNHIYLMLHSEYEYVIDTPTEYVYFLCNKPMDDSLIKHINESDMIFEICDEWEYNDVYPSIEEHYEEGQIYFLTKPE